MAIILNINTAFETANITLSRNSEIIVEAENSSQKDHASFLEPAIKNLCETAQISLQHINAISVVNGPGSYTGLRVGLSSAKALCYALNKPLILLNALDVMAYGLKLQTTSYQKNILFCPLIDARRMEVFTALYDENLSIVKPYSAEILDINFLEKEKQNNTIITGGSGIIKLKELLSGDNIIYSDSLLLSKPAILLSHAAYNLQNFSDVAYSEPFYLKPVYFKK